MNAALNLVPWRACARLGIAAVATVLAFAAPAHAADWPSRPITLVVPFPAGGPTEADFLGGVFSIHFEVADGGKPAELGPWLNAESARWGEVIRQHG